jgi:hypothetical protein
LILVSVVHIFGRKSTSQLISFALFSVIEKGTKDQADGKSSRTGPFALTVGVALARIVMASVWHK